MHEVITLQFGQRANYAGTHYWNVQESYFTYDGQEESPVDHDVSFRAGTGADGSDTFAPRALVYDLKGAFGTLRRENALYELQHEDQSHLQTPWAGDSVRLQLPPIEPSPYQQALDSGSQLPSLTTDTVRFWSDYNHVFYHPRSLIQLNEYEVNSQLMPFELWQTGEDLFDNLDREHDLLDRDLRPFLEECDQLQAIQVISSVDDAWGGFSTKYLERIEDELGKGCRWVFGLENNDPSAAYQRRAMQYANLARSIYALNSCVSTYVPLCSQPSHPPEYLNIDPKSIWHVSAIQATLIESATLPTRLRGTEPGQASFNAIETVLNNEGRRSIVSAGLSVNDPSVLEDVLNSTSTSESGPRLQNGYAEDEIHDDGKERKPAEIEFLPQNTSPTARGSGRQRRQIFSEIETLRGPWRSEEEIHSTNVATRDRFANASTRLTQHQSQLLFPVLSSFPATSFNFTNNPQKLAVRASLSTSSTVAQRLRSLGEMSRRILGVDDRETVSDGLDTMAEEYEEGWMDFSDSDPDSE